jgi:DNA modification methylase
MKPEGVTVAATRNSRSVWKIATQPRKEAHFAAFPDELARRCVLAGSKTGDLVMDPFAGRGTTLAMALQNGRNAVGIELNPAYLELARKTVGIDGN